MGKVGRETVDMMTHSLRSSEKKKKERKIREGLDLGGAQKKVNTPDFPSAKKFVTVLT